ncbi:MAG: protein kinase [Microcoleus sp. SIO2G3]|nr:protein kinase [Microcoleus sp. SIO2G3]
MNWLGEAIVIGQLLDRRYYVTQVLATGGFSQTYLAQDTRIPGHPLCVVKQLKLDTSDPQVLATMQRLFNTEAEILAKLGEYDRIPRLLAHFEENQEFYLVQEYIVGHPLLAELTSAIPWAESQVKVFLTDILQTLQFVHEHGVIHRDIKPANIIRRQSDQRLVLIDFGAVKERTTTLVSTATGLGRPSVAIGTPVYMPIEQLRGYPQFNSDLYAVGAIAIQAASGLTVNELQSALDPDFPAATIKWRDRVQVQPQLAEILGRMVPPNYHHRYQTVNEVIADLQRLSGEKPAPIVAPPTAIEVDDDLSQVIADLERISAGQPARPDLSPAIAPQPDESATPTVINPPLSTAPTPPIIVPPSPPNHAPATQIDPQPVESQPQPAQKPSRLLRSPFTWVGVGVVGLGAIAILGTPSQTTTPIQPSGPITSPSTSLIPGSQIDIPNSGWSPSASPTPEAQPSVAAALVVTDALVCESQNDTPCTGDTQVFNSNASIAVSTMFQDVLEATTQYSVRVQYTSPQGEQKDVQVDTTDNTFGAQANRFTFTLGTPSGGWSPGSYRFIMQVNSSSGSATIEKPFSVQ